jgi:hypothetical protein
MSNKRYKTLGQAGRDVDALALRVETLEDAPSGGGSEYTETIVNISSAQILAMGTTPIELLPAPGVGKYYDYEGFLEYTHVSTDYIISDDLVLGSFSSYGGKYISSNILSSTDNYIIGFNNKGGGQEVGLVAGNVISFKQLLNEPIHLFTFSEVDPTDGDGTLRVKIYHKTITFGA